MADLATLGIRVTSEGVARATSDLKGLESQGGRTEAVLGRLKGAAAALGVTFGAAWLGRKFVTETIEAQKVTAQLEAVLKSTGNTAGQSMSSLQAYAAEMQRMTTFSDDAVGSAQALLLTFTKIQGDTFPAATRAVLDIAQAMGGDLKGAALQVGKALNDPNIGLTALTRSGVSFTQAQQDTIKALFNTGQAAKAQAMILAELQKEFGGSAEAARNTLGGALAGLKNDFADLFEVTRAGTSSLIAFINATDRAVLGVREYATEIKALAVVVGAAGLARAIGVSVLAMKEFVFMSGVSAAFKIAAMEGTGLIGVLKGLRWTTLYDGAAAAAKFAAAWAPVVAIAGLGYYAIQKLTEATDDLIDAEDRDSALRSKLKREYGDFSAASLAAARARKAERDEAERQRQALEKAAAARAAEAAAIRDLHTATADKLTDAQRELAYLRANEAAVIKLMQAEKTLADQRAIVAQKADPLHRLSTGPKPVGLGKLERHGEWSGVLGGGPGTVGADALNFDLQLRVMERFSAMQKAMRRDLTEFERQEIVKQVREEERLRENFLRQWQQTVANGIASMLTDGLKSWRNFFDALGRMAAQSIGDIIATQVAKLSDAMKNAVSAGAFGASTGYNSASPVKGALGGAAAGFAIAGPVGAAVGGISGFIGGLFGASKAAKEAAIRQNELAWEQHRAAEAAKKEAEAKRAAIQFSQALYASDLRAQALRRDGFTAEAEALELWNRQVKDFADAVARGFSPELLSELSRQQEYDRLALSAKQAAEAERELADAQRKQAEAAAAAAERLAQAQERAAEFAQRLADATEDLGVRMLRAQGKAEEAERRAFEVEQARELRAAQSEARKLQLEISRIKDAYGPGQQIGDYYAPGQFQYASLDEYLAAQAEKRLLTDMLSAQNDYIKQLRDVQAAEAIAFANGQGLPGASAAAAGTAGSFNTVVSRATAVHGDRMVDLLTTGVAIWRAIEENTRATARQLGSGVNRILGADLQGAQALAGSAVVV